MTCPSDLRLAPGASITCTATYTITQADLDAGSVTNHATGSRHFDGDPVISDTATATVTAVKSPGAGARQVVAAAGTYDHVGDTLTYSYLVTNTGNVTLTAPVTVTDDRATVTCPPTLLAPGASAHLHRHLHRHPGRPRRRVGHQHRHGDLGHHRPRRRTPRPPSPSQAPQLDLDKTAAPATYDAVGDTDHLHLHGHQHLQRHP